MVPRSKASIGFTCRPKNSLGACEAGNGNHDAPRRAGDNAPSPARLGDCNQSVKPLARMILWSPLFSVKKTGQFLLQITGG